MGKPVPRFGEGRTFTRNGCPLPTPKGAGVGEPERQGRPWPEEHGLSHAPPPLAKADGDGELFRPAPRGLYPARGMRRPGTRWDRKVSKGPGSWCGGPERVAGRNALAAGNRKRSGGEALPAGEPKGSLAAGKPRCPTRRKLGRAKGRTGPVARAVRSGTASMFVGASRRCGTLGGWPARKGRTIRSRKTLGFPKGNPTTSNGGRRSPAMGRTGFHPLYRGGIQDALAGSRKGTAA